MRALLALFVRALRQSTRAPSTYLLRSAIAVALLLCLWFTHEELQWAGAPGRSFFAMLIPANYLLLSLVGLGSFSSAIAEEKEEGSLALLRMTDLNPLAILLGKSTSRLWIVFLLLAAQLPFAFLAVTLGGVSRTHVLIGYGLLSSYLFLLGNIALFFSVIARRSGFAAVLTLLMAIGVTVICGVPAATASWLVYRRHWLEIDPTIQYLNWLTGWLWSIHPITHIEFIASGRFLSLEVQRSIYIHLLGGICFFLLSLVLFERFCGNEAAYSSSGGKRGRRFAWLRRAGRASLHGIAWKDYNFIRGGRFGALVRFILFFGGTLCIARLDDYGWEHSWARNFAAVAWGFGWLFWWVELAFGALLMWGPETWGLHLGSLVSTPQSLVRITFQKLQAIALSLIPAAALLITALIVGGKVFARTSLASFWRVMASSYDWESLGLHGASLALFGTIMGVLEVAVPFVLIVNLSLRLKWTALPAAAGIYILLQTGFSMVISVMNLQSRVSYRFDPETPCKLALFGIILYFLVRNTRTLLLRRAAEG